MIAYDSGVKSIDVENQWTDPVRAVGDRLNFYAATFAGGTLVTVQTSVDGVTWHTLRGGYGADATTGKFSADTGALMIETIPGAHYRVGVATGNYGSGTTTARIWG